MEYEHGQDGLTFRFTYAHHRRNSVVITGVQGGAGAIMQSFRYPHLDSPVNIVKLFYHVDRLGSTDFLSNNVSGRVEAFTNYDSWGLPPGNSGGDPRGNQGNNDIQTNSILRLGVRQLNLSTSFTGFMFDPVLNLYFAQARMYDPATRRFMAVDPIKGNIANPQLMVPYTFVLNNPLRFIDPLGLSPTVCIEETAKAAGGTWNADTQMATSSCGESRRIDADMVNGSLHASERDLAWMFMSNTDWMDYLSCEDISNWISSGGSIAELVSMIIDAQNAAELHEEMAQSGAVRQQSILSLAQSTVNAVRGTSDLVRTPQTMVSQDPVLASAAMMAIY